MEAFAGFSDDGGVIVYKEGVLPAHTNSRLDAKRSPERRHHGRHGGSSTTTLEALGLQPPTDWYLKQQPAANVEEAADAADHEDNRFGPVGDLKAAHKMQDEMHHVEDEMQHMRHEM